MANSLNYSIMATSRKCTQHNIANSHKYIAKYDHFTWIRCHIARIALHTHSFTLTGLFILKYSYYLAVT